MPLDPNLINPSTLAGGINFNQLVPLTQMSPIQVAQPQAQQSPAPQLGGSGGGGSPLGGLGGGHGGGGLLSGLGGMLGGLGKSGGGLGAALHNMVGGGPNPISTANQALTQQMQSLSSPQIVQSLLNNPTVQAMPGMIQNTLNQVTGGQMKPGQMPSSMSPQNIQNIAQQAFQGQQRPTPLPNISNQQPNINQPRPNNGLTNNTTLDRTASSIAQIESGDSKNPYTDITKAGGGRAAYGKYQIMGENIPNWTKEATGKSYTPQEFLANPQIQDQTAKYQMQQYMKQGYGPNDVASMWFTGRPLSKAGMSAHDNSGTTNADYQKQFNKYYGQTNQQSLAQNVNNPTNQHQAITNAQQASSSGDAYKVAQAYMGYGRQNHPEILQNFFSKSMKQDINIQNTPWCAAFANSVLMSTGHGGTGSLMARSFLNYGQPTIHPTNGDVVVMQRGGANSQLGHVGFYAGLSEDGKMVKVLGGNEQGRVEIQSYPVSKVLGYRTPPGVDELKMRANSNNSIRLPPPAPTESNFSQADQMAQSPLTAQPQHQQTQQQSPQGVGMPGGGGTPQMTGMIPARQPQNNFYYMPYLQQLQ